MNSGTRVAPAFQRYGVVALSWSRTIICSFEKLRSRVSFVQNEPTPDRIAVASLKSVGCTQSVLAAQFRGFFGDLL
jgi:hypothetical protein